MIIQSGVKPYIGKCAGCGRRVNVSAPFSEGKWRGVQSGIHKPCGESYRIVRVVSSDVNTQKDLSAFFQLVRERI